MELGWPEWAAPRRAAAGGGGWRWRPAAAVGGGGGGLVAVGDGERVEEHQWEARKLAAGDVGHEEGRRGELRGDLGAAALMAGSGRLWTPRGVRFGAWSRKGSRGGGRGLVCEAKGKEESMAEAQASGELAHGTARRVRRRGASTTVLGVRAGRWCRVERPRGFGRTKDRARRVQGAWPAASRTAGAERGGKERTERVEREKKRLTDSNSNFSQKFLLKHGKLRIRKL